MNLRTSIALASAGLFTLLGCWDDDPCDPGQVFREGSCFEALPASGGAPSGGAPSGAGAGGQGEGGGSEPGESRWGVACTAPEDCGGDSPVCAPAPLGYCTNIDCAAGEPNEAICPAEWTCYPAGSDRPSACVRL